MSETVAIQKKQKRRSQSKKVAALVLVLIGNLVIFLTIWLMNKYEKVSIDQVLYQLKTSAAGANRSLMNSAYIRVGVFGVVLTAVDVFVYRALTGRKIQWLRHKQWYIELRQKPVCGFLRKFFFSLSAAFCLLAFGVFIDKLDVLDYISKNTTESDFIEEHYVNPEETRLIFPEQKRNLIYIFLESMETTYGETRAGGPITDNFIPELTQLAKENISFPGGARTYTGTTWTAAAMVAQTSGIIVKVPVGAENYGGENEYLPGVVSIGDILEEQGYRQELLIGSDGEFAARESYFTEHGNYDVVDINVLKEQGRLPEDYRVWWGFEDQKLFAYAKEELTRLSESGEPFNFTMLTADTHFPDGYVCPLCQDEYEEQYPNVIHCSSRQVADFVAWIQEQPFYENTTIVISGDHLTMDPEFMEGLNESYTRTVYNCIINSPIEPETEGRRQFGTFDMFPTTLAAMGVRIQGDRLGLGTNLFSDLETLSEIYGYSKLDEELQKRSEMYNVQFLDMEEDTSDDGETGITE